MKILHITNDFSGTEVYKNLIGELDRLGIEQIVYTPVKDEANIGRNEIVFHTNNSSIFYSHVLNRSFDRLFYRHKITKIFNDIESKIDLSTIDLIHAHTWYSDGGVAYKLHKKYNIPYLVTVRNSDLNVFQKYLIHIRGFGGQILKESKNIILISASYKQRILNLLSLRRYQRELAEKIRIIPNGLDSFWIDNARTERFNYKKNGIVDILFLGKFTRGKSLVALQKAILSLNQAHNVLKIKLHIVGGGGRDTKKVLRQINRRPDLFRYYGKIYDKERLLEIFRSCLIFAMPSKHETFGLVYVEAMLQGLPILYTHNEGIDGFYDERIGEKVITCNAQEIEQKIFALIKDYDSYTIPTDKLRINHDWKNIALKYHKLYMSQKEVRPK